MTDREAALRAISVGDIFHASDGLKDGPSYPCLALQVQDDAIFARRMTTQSVHWFDRTTGAEIDDDRVVIDSVEPLPDDIREIMLSIDRLFREAEHRRAEEPDWVPAENHFHQSKDQIRAILFIAKFYPAHPLPPRQ
ncbi:MAG: hypothetical protein J0J01_13205 [Reyranella sp.]|uniref:hypothetical protein n=1 Tax=Reyranella sp. TaxID=1929291 RepID=UPI001AC0739B|nr:hypothetical protein [Reyranella sp.]MBN9087862.1 hypothetical protein [Reyranella sp.]